MEAENELYQVKMKDDYEILFFGTMYECEHWVHTDGKIDVTYEIEKVRPKKARRK